MDTTSWGKRAAPIRVWPAYEYAPPPPRRPRGRPWLLPVLGVAAWGLVALVLTVLMAAIHGRDVLLRGVLS